LPLGNLAEAAAALAKDKPVVAVCRAGGRSAQATLILKRLGFPQVANLPGGMLRWRAQRQVVEGGSD
jgi:rhodanese-related sulfurtransferase